ncbi:Leucine-, isoleucine-, valine-, threonine-, and alanine-binding protein [Sporomusa silvacetica DSM 10669]|uniref:Leucine-, isoleucine-, valine-, threonine-, and alanine-binding protein n=1 Tax=Sporomusa silvacetica DSM 10669 TaxID=1123289 RepID=A0ABZ3IQH6_9FIRM|nr:branched-chain amino acid ABC transporter substrate-binding protein [Sporomusa silvacetica]OZC13831.1 leucine-, isoleucine-, valine-, threonine-, and alanine-binding protein precursor [Sporomusa silvacetica DSM 10669]
MKKGFVYLMLVMFVITGVLTGCGTSNSKVVKIGFVGPLTGGNAAIGIGMKNSVDLAIKQANASGKLPYKIELVAVDDAGDPTTAVNAANKLIADPGVISVVAHFNSGAALATVPVFHKNGMPTVIAAAIHNDITKGGFKEITRVITAADVQNEVAGNVATKDWGLKKFAVIHDKTDYGKTNAEQFIASVKNNGGEIVSFDGISVGQQDFAALLTIIKSNNPDMVFFGGVATEAALIKRQMGELQMNAIFMSDSGILSETFNKIGGPAADGTLAHGIGKPLEDLPGGKDFMKAYADAKYAEPHEAYAPFAYDAANIIIKALEKAGPDRVKMAEAIRGITSFEGILGETTFDDKGQTRLKIITTYISEGGKWVPYYRSGMKVIDKKIQKQ